MAPAENGEPRQVMGGALFASLSIGHRLPSVPGLWWPSRHLREDERNERYELRSVCAS